MTLVYKWLAGLAIQLLALAGVAWSAYGFGSDSTQAQWDISEAKRVKEISDETKREREAGYLLAAEYKDRIRELESIEVKIIPKLERTLRTSKVQCKDSMVLSDLVVPADVVWGMLGNNPGTD